MHRILFYPDKKVAPPLYTRAHTTSRVPYPLSLEFDERSVEIMYVNYYASKANQQEY